MKVIGIFQYLLQIKSLKKINVATLYIYIYTEFIRHPFNYLLMEFLEWEFVFALRLENILAAAASRSRLAKTDGANVWRSWRRRQKSAR